MTGNEFLKLAGELFAPYFTGVKPPNEALFRTIIGRTYYGAFHLTVAYLEELGFKTDTHGQPSEYLRASGQDEAKRAGRLLHDLYEVRKRADYKLSHRQAVSESRDFCFVRDQIELASELMSLLEKCNIEPAKSAVKSGIQAHRQRNKGS